MKTIYLVDDDMPIINAMLEKRDLLLGCGFEIIGAETNPIRALDHIRAKRPDVVFSDLKMPELSGVGLVEVLRRDNIPLLFVIISGYKEFEEMRKFFTVHNGFDYLLKPVSDVELTNLLGRLYIRLGGQPPEPETETPSRELNEILKHLKEYPAMNHTLESVGTLFNIHQKTVCKLFTKHLNTTFVAHLMALRMERAEGLLRTTNMTVKEVGINAGYTNYFYFTKVFAKTHDGKTPTEYRSENYEKR
ncbi:MAG: helix-turn-helix domain-containing protein [Oscillospiraceae bacterium]|jgi:two-component system response regulator YesN|nr:helix-turn-helix domain-containing protein [Oscillospiraceae bacterium]